MFTLFTTFLTWLERLGGLGLILLGVADNSMILPGSMDALTLFLSAHQRSWWPYYAAMATIGTVIGAYVTYTLGRKGGKETLMRRLSSKRAEKIYRGFSKHGFWSLFIPALNRPQRVWGFLTRWKRVQNDRVLTFSSLNTNCTTTYR